MKRVKLVFNSEMWEIYEEGSNLPFHAKTTYDKAVHYCKKNDYWIVEVDDSNLD
jgi:hypothetical protein